MAPHQIDVRHDEPDERSRQQEHVRRIPAQQRQRPRSLPPRISAAICSPKNGALRAMLIVTVVAQYAFWSHGSR